MKIPERIVGFLELQDTKFPFEFDKDRFELKLYHPTKYNAYEQIFEGVKSFGINLKEHKWLDKITIRGKTAERYLVYFGVLDNPSSYNGYHTYKADWYYITDNEELINEVRFYGREIDYFYSPTRTFQQNIKYKEEKCVQVKSMSVHTVDCEALKGGSYISRDVNVEILCDSYAIMYHQANAPLDSKSYLKLKFSRKINLEKMIDKVRDVQSFLKYVSYRTNINIDDISTYIAIEDGKVRNCGKLVFRVECKEERNEKAKERIIRAEYINEHIAEILKAIDRGEMPFGHFCDSIEAMSHYPISRIIMILAAFEREFRNIYGPDVRRSEDYKDTKDHIIKLIEEYAAECTGKRKKYVKDFAKVIRNSDSSYGDNFKYALEDCKGIMEPFVIRRFEGTYEEIIEDVSISVNRLRNGVAHSRLDMELEARHLTDIKFVEEMLYVIRLKKIGIEDAIIKKSINELFRENLAL